MSIFHRVCDDGIVVATNETDHFVVGQRCTMADCGGISSDPDGRFKHACHCGSDCRSGSHPIVLAIESLSDEIRSLSAARDAAKQTWRNAENRLLAALRANDLQENS